MTKSVDQLVEQLTAFKWIAVIVVVVLSVIGVANFAEAVQKLVNISKDTIAHFKGRLMSDVELREKATTTAKEIMSMVQSRQSAEPDFTFENFESSAAAQSKHSQETLNLYFKDFAGPVANIREEFLKRGLRDKELDNYYEHPTNYIGLRIVAMRIAFLAEQIRGGQL